MVADLREPLALDPDAPRPSFQLTVELPAGWSVLDTNPRTWRRSAEILVSRFGAEPTTNKAMKGPERREVLQTLESLVGRCQSGGVSLSIIALGRLQPGTAFSVGLHLAFVRGDGPAGLGPARELTGRSGSTVELAGVNGPFLMHRSRSTAIVPGTASVVGLTHLQAFVPLPNSPWTAVVSTSTPHEELIDPLERLLGLVAGSLQRADPDHNDEETPEPATEAVFEAVATDPMPGLGKGFGTMIRRSVAATDDQR